ncbi:MAG: glycoside hydrolase family 25 [Ruminococcus sp.]|nr:glycoside hydrolase family 25 [Ruminococcus sp.]
MKYKLAIPAAALLTLTCGCGKIKSSGSPSEVTSSSAETASTAVSETTTAVTTKAVITTTKKAEPPKDLVMENKQKLGVYDKVKVADFITSTNAVLTEPDAAVDTSKTGSCEITVKYEINGSQYEKTLSYTVEDNTDPIVLNSGWAANHVRGTQFDLGKYVGYADNYDSAPVLTYTGNIDPNTSGSYPITATVTDSSGNSTSWDLIIKVADSFPPTQYDNGDPMPFTNFIGANANTGAVSFGIDVSEWQGDIDFNAVKSDGCSFVFMRAGYCYSHIVKDPYFDQNFSRAKAAGLNTGLYFYTTASNEEQAREQARWVIEQLGGQKLELPIAFDWEEFGTFQEYGMSIHDINEVYLAFADEVEKAGYTPMLYSSKNFLNTVWSEDTKKAHPVWLAHFIDRTDYTGEYDIWQGSCTGKISGIYGDVDLNVLYKELPLS